MLLTINSMTKDFTNVLRESVKVSKGITALLIYGLFSVKVRLPPRQAITKARENIKVLDGALEVILNHLDRREFLNN